MYEEARISTLSRHAFNLKILDDSFLVVEELRNEGGITLTPPDSNICTARALLVYLGSEKGAIIIPAEDVQIHGKKSWKSWLL